MIHLYILGVLSIFGSSYGLSELSTEAKIWKSLGVVDKKFIPGDKGLPLRVNSSLSLVSLTDFDEAASTMRVGYWLKLNWQIPSLRWDPRDYNNIKTIRVPRSDIWVPDVVPFVHTGTELLESNAVIFNTGSALWVPHVLTTVLCTADPSAPRYPRDQMICRLKIGSWTYDGLRLNFTIDNSTGEADRELISVLDPRSLESSGWKFQEAKLIYGIYYYPCCKEPYINAEARITIKRKDLYFALAISVPGMVVGLTSALLYLLPPVSSARIISQIVCLLIFVIIGVTDLRLIGSTVLMAPAAHYFIAAMILNLLAIGWSIFTAVAWMQASYKASRRGVIDSILSKLECICLLPAAGTQEQQDMQLDDGKENELQTRIFGLRSCQRFILVLDRFFSLVNIVIIVLLFIFLGA